MEECDIKFDSTEELTIHAGKVSEGVIRKLNALSLTLALAESCTAGLVSGLLAGTAGASGVLWGSFVCYTKEAKVSMLGLDNDKLADYGLVSRETALSMAIGALQKSGASLAAAVTGLAGPSGDGSGVPVGTVWVATALRNGLITEAREFHFSGSRNAVRIRAAVAVFESIQRALDTGPSLPPGGRAKVPLLT